MKRKVAVGEEEEEEEEEKKMRKTPTRPVWCPEPGDGLLT